MREVLLTDVALWGALITAAALIIIRRGRRSQPPMPARGRREDTAPRAAHTMPPPRTQTGTGPGANSSEPGHAAPGPARPAPAAPPPATQIADPRARPHRPGAQRHRQQAPPGAATPREQIASYYDQADQPIAGYLAALGWTQRLHPPPPPAAATDAGPAAEPQGGTVSP